MVQALLLLLIGILVFHISVVGNVLLAFIVIALLAVVSQAMGILLSSTARREAQAIQVLPFVILPAFSGPLRLSHRGFARFPTSYHRPTL